MKRIIFAVAALIAACSFGASYKDWFAPKSGWKNQKVPVKIKVSNWDYIENYPVNAQIGDIARNLERWIAEQEIPESAKNAFKLSVSALANSIFAACQAQMNKVKIDNLGAALEGMFVNTYGQYQDESGNVISKTKSGIDTSALRQQLIANKNAVVSGGQASGGSESNPLKLTIIQKPYDELQFEQHTADGKSLTSLKGWHNLQDNAQPDALGGADYFAFGTKDYYFPISWGKSTELEWARWNGWDEDCFSAGDDEQVGENSKPLHLRDWAGGNGGCTLTLKGLLTNKDDPDYQAARNSHTIMTRCNDNGTYKLHYMSVGGLIDSLTAVEPDEVSIETHTNDDGTTNLCVYGFNEANEVAKSKKDIGIIPYANGSNTLAWAGLSEFFSDKVFDTTESGKIILNGVSEEGSDKVRVLAVKGSGDSQEVGTVAFDNASVDGNIETAQIVQMHNFSTAPSPYGGYSQFTFADSLTNNSASISGMSVPVRYPNGNRAEIAYIPMGKITGIPSASCDNKTIEATKDKDAVDNAPDKLRIVGSKDATKGQLLKMGDNGKVEWGDFPIEVDRNKGLPEDEYPLYITAADPVQDEPAKIGINGWETTDSPEGLYGAGNGKPVTYRFADIQSLEADGNLRTIELTGYGDAGNYSVAYKDSEDGLGWVAPPSSGSALLTMNHGAEPTATVLGNSVETETINNKVTLNSKGFTNGGGCDTTMSSMMTEDSQSANRSNHQVLTRYSTGSGTPALHWVPMGNKVSGGGGADVDGVSITTNTANGAVTSGLASIYGFSTASAGDVPHKKSDGTIEWKKASGGTSGSFALTVNKVNDTSYTFSIQSGFVCRARKYNFVNGTTVSGTGYVWLKSTMGSTASVIEMGTSTFVQSTDEYTYTPLYFVNGTTGAFTDYRFAPHIQEWE